MRIEPIKNLFLDLATKKNKETNDIIIIIANKLNEIIDYINEVEKGCEKLNK